MPPEPSPRPAAPSALRALLWILFALLLSAAIAALVGLPRALQGGWSNAVRLVPVALLVLFIGGYATWRFAMVRAGRYSAGKALVRVMAMLLALGVIAGIALERPPVVVPGGLDLAAPLASPDPVTRALAAELLRARPRDEGRRHVERLLGLLADPSADVRREARASLATLAGEDAGEGAGAEARWRALCRDRGLLTAAP